MDAQARIRPVLVAARWMSLLACGAVAATVVLLADAPLSRLGGPVAGTLGQLHPSAMLAVVSVLIAACCWAAARGRWRGFVGLRFLPGYPPLWIAVVFGLLAWTLGRAWIGGLAAIESHAVDLRWFAAQFPWQAWGFGSALVLGVVLPPLIADAQSALRRRAAASAETRPATSVAADFDALRGWLEDDAEVTSPEDDLFDHYAIAMRVAERLLDPKEAPTMAIIGPLGSGKSTIRRLVQHRLIDERQTCIISLSLWPLDSPEAAVRGILRALVRGLSRQVNVLPLVGLSDDYVTAIEKSAGMYGGIARLLRGTSDPASIVQRFSDIARAAGVRLVLWVEDLERFSGGDQLEGTPRAEREVERLGPIRALLHLLDRSPQVSVIVSDVTLRTRFDLGKIARFVEQVPPMAQADAWRAVQLLRTTCLGGYPIAVIDAASPKTREALTFEPEKHSVLSWLSAFREANLSVPVAAVRVLKTPRMLKSALRLALETWEAMPGEIDFDSVLVASVLRAARPDLFAVVADHIDVFQHGMKNPLSLGREKDKPHPVVGRIDEMLEHEEDGVAAAIRRLLSYLFAKYPPGSDDNDREYMEQPQALCVDRHADYWRRYMAQTPVPESESDQRALKSIGAWRAGKPSDLIERLIDPARNGQIETFVGQFKASELCRLLTEVADRLSSESASEWEHRSHAPGVTSVWRMMHRRHPREEDVFRAVRDLVQRLAAVHLPLAHDIWYFFAGSSGNVPSLISDPQRREVREALGGVLVSHFTGEGAEDRLALALRDGSPWVVLWVAWGMDRIKVDDRSGLPVEGWAEFANVLLNLAERRPDLGVPLVVPFVTTSNMAHRHFISEEGEWESVNQWVGEFDEEAAKRLFNFERLIRILTNWQPPPDIEGQMRANCEAAIAGAKRFARGKHSHSEDRTK